MLDGLRRAALSSPDRSRSPEHRPKAAARRSSTQPSTASSPAVEAPNGRTRKRAVIKIAPQTTAPTPATEPSDKPQEVQPAPLPTDDADGSFKPSGWFDSVMYG